MWRDSKCSTDKLLSAKGQGLLDACICQVDVNYVLLCRVGLFSVKGNTTETDPQWSRQQHCRMLLFMFPISQNTQKLNSHLMAHTHPQRRTAGPCLRSRRSMDLLRGESKRFEAYVKSLWIQNKALSRTLCLGRAALLCRARLASGDTILPVQDESHHHPFTSSCALPLQTAADSAPIWAAAQHLPARLKRGPWHPGDWVYSHYPLWEKLRGGTERTNGGRRGEQNKKKVCLVTEV